MRVALTILALLLGISFLSRDDMEACQEYHSFDTCAHTLWR